MSTITQKTAFDKVAKFYTSLAAIIIFNFVFMAYRGFEVFTLFDRQLSTVDNIATGFTQFFSSLIAIILVNAVLIVSVNLESLKQKKLAEISAFLFSLFLNVLFWQAWQGSLESMVFKSVISVTFACLDTFFAHLFITMWAQRNEMLDKEQEATTELAELQEQTQTLRKAHGDLAKQKHTIQEEIKQLKKDVEDYKFKLLETTCPHTGREFDTKEKRNRHLHQHFPHISEV